MNKTLIDSHVLLWILYEPEKIGKEAMAIIRSSNEVFVSLTSLLELTLKYKKGKLHVTPTSLLKNINDLKAEILSITEKHIVGITDIDSLTKDPFDLLLMSQAKAEGIFLLTADGLMLKNPPDYVIDARI